MILITSGAYVTESLIAELGILPPAFLPVGNRRLYQLQVESLGSHDDQVYLSLPDDFNESLADRKLLIDLGIQVIKVPSGLSLGNSILYCWNSTGVRNQTLKIYHGDTLLAGQDFHSLDVVSIFRNSGFYERASFFELEQSQESSIHEEGGDVLAGYFSIRYPEVFFKGVLESKGSFLKGLSYYNKNVGLQKSKPALWLDFGHLNSFFQSRMSLTTERSFNSIEIEKGVVTKRSVNEKKLNAESYWYRSVPGPLHLYLPSLLDFSDSEGKSFYCIEYLYLLPLNDLYIFSKLGERTWERIFGSCNLFLETLRSYTPNNPDIDLDLYDSLYLPKTLDRLSQFEISSQFDLSKKYEIDSFQLSLSDIAKIASNYIRKPTISNISIIHGDFCFSNILYDSRSMNIKVIDPRGLGSNLSPTVYGDNRYDVAKLYHSIIGLYDYIISDRFEFLDESNIVQPEILFSIDEDILAIQKTFRLAFFNQNIFIKKEIVAINVQLFLSMVPLHADNPRRQKAMIANAIRLFKLLQSLNL